MSCKCWFCTGFPGRLLKGCWPIGGDSFVFPLFIPPVDWVLSLAHQQPSWTMRCPKGWKPALGWWNKKIGTGSLMPGQSPYQLWAAKLEVLLRWIRNKLLLCWSHFHFGFSNKIATLSFCSTSQNSSKMNFRLTPLLKTEHPLPNPPDLVKIYLSIFVVIRQTLIFSYMDVPFVVGLFKSFLKELPSK